MIKNNSQTYGLIPPQALDIESAVLGALMLEHDAIHKVTGIIDSNTFYLESSRIIFEIIKTLSKQCKPIDLLTVTRGLNDSGKLDQVGGPLFITQLTSKIASAAHIEYHARILAQLAIQRELIKIGSDIQKAAYENGADIDDLLSDIKRKISDIENIAITGNDGSLQSDVLESTFKEIADDCERAKNGTPPGITSGLSILDKFTGGFRNTNLIIIAARPGIGKTSLALFFAICAAKAGKWVNFYTLEMRSNDLQRIVISGESTVNRSAIRDGHVTDHDWSMMNAVSNTLDKLTIIWNDTPITADQIKAKTIKNKRLGRCDLVIIDYLQLITASDKKLIREQQIANISRTLKQTALSENIPIILLSQLNRQAAERETPQLNDLRESGAIEQDADIVIFPNRKDNDYSLTIAKNRRGKVGTFEIYANEEMTRFADKGYCSSNGYSPDHYTEPNTAF